VARNVAFMRFHYILMACVCGFVSCRQRLQFSEKTHFELTRVPNWVANKSSASDGGPYTRPGICAEWPNSMRQVVHSLAQAGVSPSYLDKGPLFVGSISGCQPWWILSDREIKKTFSQVASVLGNHEHEIGCISVGFMQPWLMLGSLPCRTLTIIDVSPLTNLAHKEIYSLVKPNNVPISLDEVLKKLHGMGLLLENSQKRSQGIYLTVEDICGHDSSFCREAWLRALQRLTRLDRFEILRSPLHEAVSMMGSSSIRPVFYLSNATDPSFTNQIEVGQLVRDFAQFSNQRGLLIYHMSSEPYFGIYRASGARPEVVCADRYLVSPSPARNLCAMANTKFQKYETLSQIDRLIGLALGAKTVPCSQTTVMQEMR